MNQHQQQISTIIPSSDSSPTETRIIQSKNPIEVETREEIEATGERGIWMNRNEINGWSGPIPLEQYELNRDPNPEVIRKKPAQAVNYKQEFAVRFLRPPTPPPPGNLVIVQENSIQTPEAPPLIIRQEAARQDAPAQIVIREAPPNPIRVESEKVIRIPGRRLPPPPRRVIIERLAPPPAPPPSILVERWLSYPHQQRRVIFKKANEPEYTAPKPRNLLIQWETADSNVTREYRDLGVARMNPNDYVSQFGTELKHYEELPDYAKYSITTHGLVLASNITTEQKYELVGDLYALSMIDLDREGLGDYKSYLQSSIQSGTYTLGTSPVTHGWESMKTQQPWSQLEVSATPLTTPSGKSQSALDELVSSITKEACEKINVSEVKRLMRSLSERHKRKINDQDVEGMLHKLDRAHTGIVDYDEFLRELSSFYWNKL